jgi:hypothetical protein
MSRYELVIADLQRVCDEIDEMSIAQLREDIASGLAKSGVDRDLMRARRAVEKASAILRQLSQDSESPTDI